MNLDHLRINKEHFWRELTIIYENYDNFHDKKNFNKEKFIRGFSEYICDGGEFEIMDGDNNEVHSEIL